jgi:hypothetical protein
MKELEGDPQGNVLAQILTALGGFNARLIDINEHVQDSHRALRGYDAEPGLVAITEELRKQVEEISKNTGADHDAIASLIHRIEALEKYNIDYPPLAWLVRHRLKAVALWAAAGLALMTILLSPVLNKDFVAMILHLLKIPQEVIDFYVGK